MNILETPRLILRHPRMEDAEPVARLWADSDVTRYMGGPRDFEKILGMMEEEARSKQLPPYDLWPLILKETGEIIGHCGLIDKEVEGKKEMEVIYVIAASHWGRGYAREIATALLEYGARELGAIRIIALIDPENIGSERVAAEAGMRLEKETIRPSGKTMKLYVWERG